jgi:DNA replication and repair protein RecF
MAVVKKLSVQNIRSHDKTSIILSPTTSVITGKNGSGKTSLIEALYISLQGSSFKGSDSDVLKHNTDWWRIDVEFIDTNKRTVSFDPSLTSGRKKFTVDDKVFYRLPTQSSPPPEG